MKIIVDNSYSKIVDITEEDEKILEIIDSTLSCYQPGYQFSDAYQMGVWDGKVRFLNKRNYTFPSGLLNVVKEVIPESVEIVYNITPFDIEVPEEINLLEPNAEKGYITLRDYQRNAVEEALKKTRGIINVATNGGKTEIAAGIIQLLYSKLKKGQTILFVTHNKEIFHQSAKRLEKRLDMEIGKVGDGYWNVKPVTVVMIPTVSRYIKKPKIQPLKPQQYKGEFKAIKLLVDLVGKNKLTADGIRNLVSVLEKENDSTCMLAIDILGRIYDTGNYDQEFKKLREALREYEMKRQSKSFEKYNKTMDLLKSAICFIGDECHHASSSTWYDTLMLCENSVYRFGLTGTVDKSDEVNYLRLLGCMGEVVYKISNDFLIKRGYSAKPTIYFTEIKKPELKSDNWLRLYKEGIVENEYRNRKIAEQVAKHCEQGDSCLVIVNHTTHGRKLKELIEEKGVLVEFTHGNRSSFDRDRLLNELRDGKLQCLIATTILDEGVDVSNIDALWLAAGGRSMRQVLQRIGRGLRVGKNKNSVSVYDFLDLMHPLLAKHTKERYMIYKKEKFKIKKLE